MDEEQAVFEQITWDFKKWSSTALKTSNNSIKNIMSVVLSSPLLIFELIQLAALVNFENLILNSLKKKLHISCLVGYFSVNIV